MRPIIWEVTNELMQDRCLSAMAATLVGCGVRATTPAEHRSTKLELAAPTVTAAFPFAAPEHPRSVDENARRREAARIERQEAQQNYEQSKIAMEQAGLHATEASDESRAARWHRDQERESLRQAQQAELDVRLELERDRQLARIGAVTASVLSEAEEAARAAAGLVSGIQSTVDSSVNEVLLLEGYQHQSAQELRRAQDHVSETQDKLAAVEAAFNRIPPPDRCAAR